MRLCKYRVKEKFLSGPDVGPVQLIKHQSLLIKCHMAPIRVFLLASRGLEEIGCDKFQTNLDCLLTTSTDIAERNRNRQTDVAIMTVTAQRIQALFCRVAGNQQELDMQRLLARLKL